MTVGKWDAEAWHKQHTSAPKQQKRGLVYLAIAVALVVAGGATATQIIDEPEMIGICHATPSGTVFLIVPKDGYEHGHHRHNPDNYFVDPGAGCLDDEPIDPVIDEVVEANGTEEPINDVPVNETEAPADEPADEVINETISDAAIRLQSQQDGESVWLTLSVSSLGDADAADTTATMDLPNVGRNWALQGDDAADCVLGDRLDCWFGDLAPGGTRQIVLVAHLDQLPCGDGITLTANLGAIDDAEPRNDASSASIVPRSC